jgi:hypothetical protein
MEPHRRGISTESRGPHLIIVACAVLSQNTPLRFHSQHTTGHPPPSKSLEERSLSLSRLSVSPATTSTLQPSTRLPPEETDPAGSRPSPRARSLESTAFRPLA